MVLATTHIAIDYNKTGVFNESSTFSGLGWFVGNVVAAQRIFKLMVKRRVIGKWKRFRPRPRLENLP